MIFAFVTIFFALWNLKVHQEGDRLGMAVIGIALVLSILADCALVAATLISLFHP